ncbi:MAG: UDP-N-acetylenolpyruvoylglucosamine reductase [Candidatus Blackburnbacteria bacterium RIFCSPHIGHO2_12_FULL_41_13b]|uniref:UDP-N-acetylenolpyruvoylglucosamine reductase n=1 Tax=Candidatus Blackburnbacteria bacterium RIFCSPHIGHO2_12_FULL_41_13b TaxID=1797517 RepID=A0A1G1VAN3_9BACT|nr:MAG: UDP-N-acetylenolpyruvoylglucosamine reductase [Candidatus Blackburnbacteria bacterium RIFCSPHIGHO2_12_FULL_41_13b]
MIKILENLLLKEYTTLNIGGYARCFVEVHSIEELKDALQYAKDHNLEFYIIAGGSDLLVNDEGFPGLIIKLSLQGLTLEDERIKVAAGTSLQDLVNYTIEHGFAGIEKLNNIPGSVGGAVYGNAGAFGQTISDKLVRIRVLVGDEEKYLNKQNIGFDYRESILKKHKDWVILEIEFKFDIDNPVELKKTAKDVLETRKQKYTPGIKCPGSFFKNLIIDRLPKDLQKDMPKDYYGKVPAWWFLEQVGAKGATRGQIKISDHHANLFINQGEGTAADFFALAKEYKNKIKEKFGVDLEPEVQLLGFKEKL